MAKKTNKGKAVIPTDESKADRFIRVVQPRVAKAVKSISTIGFCAGASYEYTEDQIKQIAETLIVSLRALQATFVGKGEVSGGFTFKDK